VTIRLAGVHAYEPHREVVDHVVDRAAGGHPGTIGESRPERLPLIVIARYEIDRYLQPFK
jgi:hypothetical protein